MNDVSGNKLVNGDQVIRNSPKGQSFEEILVENDKYFLIGICKTPLTKELIKEFRITKWKDLQQY